MSGSKPDIIRAIFAAYLSDDRKAVEAALTEDFRFTSPYDDRIDKATYFERCWRNSDWIERHELEKIFVEGNEAFVTYRCVAREGKSFRNTEFFSFDGDKGSPHRGLFRRHLREWRLRQTEVITRVSSAGLLGTLGAGRGARTQLPPK
jgi:ketosteroid isomerase-like protein